MSDALKNNILIKIEVEVEDLDKQYQPQAVEYNGNDFDLESSSEEI